MAPACGRAGFGGPCFTICRATACAIRNAPRRLMREHAVELLQRQIEEGRVVHHAGVVHQHVDAAVGFECGSHRGRDVRRLGNVAVNEGGCCRPPLRWPWPQLPRPLSLTSQSTILAPSLARRTAHAWPMPCAAPVTIATLPDSSIGIPRGMPLASTSVFRRCVGHRGSTAPERTSAGLPHGASAAREKASVPVAKFVSLCGLLGTNFAI